MVSFFATALPLLYLTIFGAVPAAFSAHLMLFTALTGAASLISQDSFIIIGVPLAATVIAALVDITRRNLMRIHPLLCIISALAAIPQSPLPAAAALVYLAALLLHKAHTLAFTAVIAALLLSLEISVMYYLSTPAYLLTSLLLGAFALLLNRSR